MHRVNAAAVAAFITLGFLAGCSMPTSERSVTAYEGARLIIGDGRVIENGMLVVDGTKIAQAGAAADVRVPAGATRVSLAGKTAMPMIVDTHVHLSETRDTLIRDLKQPPITA
jgi:imidazolonepropionase-like amidohydrolase